MEWFKVNAVRIVQVSIGAIIVGVVGWVTLAGQVDDNKDSAKKAHQRITKHIELTKAQPMVELEVSLAVAQLTKDLDENEGYTKENSDIIIQLVANQNILVQNDTRQTQAIEKMTEDIGKIKGKLDIE